MNSDEFVLEWFKAQVAYLEAEDEEAKDVVSASIEGLLDQHERDGGIVYL